MEAVTILAVILQKVRLSSILEEPPKPLMKVTLRPKRTLSMRAERR
jgi:hypothetical protein